MSHSRKQSLKISRVLCVKTSRGRSGLHAIVTGHGGRVQPLGLCGFECKTRSRVCSMEAPTCSQCVAPTCSQCVRYSHFWLAVNVRRCNVCYYCIQDRYLMRCRRRVDIVIFLHIVSFLPCQYERWSDAHLIMALE